MNHWWDCIWVIVGIAGSHTSKGDRGAAEGSEEVKLEGQGAAAASLWGSLGALWGQVRRGMIAVYKIMPSMDTVDKGSQCLLSQMLQPEITQ